MLKNIVKNYIKSNPDKIAYLLRLHNRILGFNKIRISPNNKLKIGAVLMKNTTIMVKGINNTITIKNLSRLVNCSIYISGNNNNIVISRRAGLNKTDLHMEDDNNKIFIGENTSIFGDTQLAAMEGTSVRIGKDCMFSSDIQFRTGDSHSIIDSDGKRLNPSENIYIGNHVWVGTKVICLKGVHIADNCIVGAGSLLTKKFNEENVIVAGNPAKIVKHNINWLVKRI